MQPMSHPKAIGVTIVEDSRVTMDAFVAALHKARRLLG